MSIMMEGWIEQFEAEVHLFEGINIREAATISIPKWDRAKYSSLENSAYAKVSHKIYSEIHAIAKPNVNGDAELFENTIGLGLEIFSWYLAQNMNPIGKSAIGSLPKSFYQNYSREAIENVHSNWQDSSNK